MMHTLDCDADFFRSTALPQICVATGAKEDLAEYVAPLSDAIPQNSNDNTLQIPLLFSRPEKARIRRYTSKSIFAGMTGFCSGLIISIASFLDHPLPRWLVLICIVGMVGCWIIAGILIIRIGRMEPLVELLADGKTVRIRFPVQGDAAHAAFREAYERWRLFAKEAPPAKEVEEPWTAGVRSGWDEAATKNDPKLPAPPDHKITPDNPPPD